MGIQERFLLKEDGDQLLLESGDAFVLEGAYEPFQGYMVFPFVANWATEPTDVINRSMTTLDNTTGLHTVRTHTTTPIVSFKILVTLEGRDEIQAFRNFMRDLRGRTSACWVPTWQADLTPYNGFSGGIIEIDSIGYTSTLYPFECRRRLALINAAGLIQPVRVTSAWDTGTKENLSVSPDVSPAIPKEACLISFLLLARLESDTVEMRFFRPELAEVRLGFVEVPREVVAP